MPIVNTNGSDDPISLSLSEVYGHRITTIITMDKKDSAPLQGNFKNHIIGTNKSLVGKRVLISTDTVKVTPTANTQVDYSLKGASSQHDDSDKSQFGDGMPTVGHYINYHFI